MRGCVEAIDLSLPAAGYLHFHVRFFSATTGKETTERVGGIRQYRQKGKQSRCQQSMSLSSSQCSRTAHATAANAGDTDAHATSTNACEAVRRKTTTRLSQLSSRLKALHDDRNLQPKRHPADAHATCGSIAVLSLRASIFETLKILSASPATASPPAGSSWEKL
jgi:hypothetical protein